MIQKLSILRNSRILTLGLSSFVSGIGNWITMMAVLAILVFRDSGGVLESSTIFLAGLLPMLVASPFAGFLADRFDRKNLMILSEVLAGLSVIGLIFAENEILIYGMLALQAVFVSLMIPARQAALPDLVSESELVQANAFFQQLNGVIKIVAPMLAGFLLTILTPQQAIILNVVSLGISAVILTRLPSLPPLLKDETLHKNKIKGVQGNEPAWRKAFREVPSLKLLFVSIFLGITVIMGLDILASVFIRDVLRETEQYYGTMVGLIGVGTFIATLVLMFRRKQVNPWRDVILGIFLLAGIPAMMAITDVWVSNIALAKALVLAGSMIGGIGNGLMVVQMGTLLQVLAPRELLGRLVGLFEATAVAGQLISVLLVPVLVPGLISMAVFLGISSILLIAVDVYILLKVHSFRALNEASNTAVAHSLNNVG
ncbi:MAG: hypothetical protein BGO78_02125 [Chloroflexi bacterium 44-23]|nr:MAG: hypothetical protein BGO78_02125 [Chloroflexi bacterium 44-23]